MARARRGFGKIRRLPSKRFQASYVGPDGTRHTAPDTFESKEVAEDWLARERRLLQGSAWVPPSQRGRAGRTFRQYAKDWLGRRELKPRTTDLYQGILDRDILPTFGELPITMIKAADVRAWYATLDPAKATGRAHAYALLRTIFRTAVIEEVIAANPCTIPGAGQTKRKRAIEPATLSELETLAASMPDRLHLLPLLAAWCGLRFGELAELRRADVDAEGGRLLITRAVTHVGGVPIVGTPKSLAGRRVVHVPPHLMPAIEKHLAKHTAPNGDALLFPMHVGGDRHMTTGWLFKMHWQKARKAAGRPDLRFHDLRHTGAVLAAQTGATLAELMARLGHSTPIAAMRYQHAAQGRDAIIAAEMSRRATSRV